jgi:hypothetical protein
MRTPAVRSTIVAPNPPPAADTMKIVLTPRESRVIGCLMEKEVTTPENYPLSLNALTAACNQKSNRDPVLELSEQEVQAIVDGLMKRHLVSDRSGFGSRVTKYKQVFCNTSMGPLQFSDIERAIVCELLLRGAQTVGELRTRCQRMASIAEVREVEQALDALQVHEAGPFVVRLPRQPGMRDVRFAHLLGGEVLVPEAATPAADPAGSARPAGASLPERVERLEAEVAELRRAVESMRSG